MSSSRIAICGKGGVGKTTLAALLGRCLAGRPNTRALLVDADPAGGLSLALGLRPEKTLNDLRVAALEAARGAAGDRRELAATLDYLLLEALVERGNLALLSAGRPDERGCY